MVSRVLLLSCILYATSSASSSSSTTTRLQSHHDPLHHRDSSSDMNMMAMTQRRIPSPSASGKNMRVLRPDYHDSNNFTSTTTRHHHHHQGQSDDAGQERHYDSRGRHHHPSSRRHRRSTKSSKSSAKAVKSTKKSASMVALEEWYDMMSMFTLDDDQQYAPHSSPLGVGSYDYGNGSGGNGSSLLTDAIDAASPLSTSFEEDAVQNGGESNGESGIHGNGSDSTGTLVNDSIIIGSHNAGSSPAGTASNGNVSDSTVTTAGGGNDSNAMPVTQPPQPPVLSPAIIDVNGESVSHANDGTSGNADSVNDPAPDANNGSSGISSESNLNSNDAVILEIAIDGTDSTSDSNFNDNNNNNINGDSTTDHVNPSDSSISTSGGSSNSVPLTVEQRASIITTKCSGHTILSRSLSLLHLLGEFVTNPEQTLVSQSGPGYNAYLWLVYFDNAILCPPTEDADASSDSATVKNEERIKRIRQRYALAVLYFSTNGYAWSNCSSEGRWFVATEEDEDEDSTIQEVPPGPCLEQGSGSMDQEEEVEAIRFLDGSHECNWFGITCNQGFAVDHAIEADAYVPVMEISLPDNNLDGEVPMDVYRAFDELEVLKLNDNKLTGEIPFSTLSSLINLDTLELSGNNLSGNATEFCNILSVEDCLLTSFETDCDSSSSSMTCPCCTRCT